MPWNQHVIIQPTAWVKFPSRSRSRLKSTCGSIKPWFSFFYQTLVKNFSTHFDFIFSTRPWLKNRTNDQVFVVNFPINLIRICLTFCNRTLIEKFPADFDENFFIKPWFWKFHRDHDPDWNHDPDQSNPDWKTGFCWLNDEQNPGGS